MLRAHSPVKEEAVPSELIQMGRAGRGEPKGGPALAREGSLKGAISFGMGQGCVVCVLGRENSTYN